MKRIYILPILVVLALTACSQGISGKNKNPLPVPPIIDGPNINLTIQHGELILPSGTSKTMGYNGNYLGPTIRFRDQDLVDIKVLNELEESTTVHWHGLHVPAEFDGGPHQKITPGSTWNPKFTIDQKAATIWYHPHLMGTTAEHVYNGLAGMFYITDDYSESQDIPKEYAVNDFPLVLQDRRILEDGTFKYQPNMRDMMSGYIGNTMLVNGAVEPQLEVAQGTYRFRIINGSNSSIYNISFDDKRKFTVIASDGGFLPNTVNTDMVVLSSGERYEILVDIKESDHVNLMTQIVGGPAFRSLEINATKEIGSFFDHPQNFEYEAVNVEGVDVTERTFTMETKSMGQFSINQKQMSMKRIDFKVQRDTTEVWTVENMASSMMPVPHSFHVHDVQFSVLSFNGKKPSALYSGPKDTILLMPGEKAVIAMVFEDYTGLYMYHCHFLEHEDEGMMGQFEIY